MFRPLFVCGAVLVSASVAYAQAPLFGWPSAASLRPGVGAFDTRVAVDPSRAPWRGIGRVQTELGGRCTGALIGPATVLTAAHCLYLPRPGAFARPKSVHFLLGYHHGRFAAHARVTSFRTGPGYDPSRETATAGADWAVLTLDQPIGGPDRILAMQVAEPPPGTASMLGGYGKDRAEVIEADLGCTIVARTRDGQGRPLLLHDCAATSGTSGAPLLVQASPGLWGVVGVQVGANQGRTGGVAAMPPVSPPPTP